MRRWARIASLSFVLGGCGGSSNWMGMSPRMTAAPPPGGSVNTGAGVYNSANHAIPGNPGY